MKTAAIYARVSSDKQKEENTIASQTAALTAFAADQGYAVPTEWIFEDEGYSGASLIRPGLERVRDSFALAADRRLVPRPAPAARCSRGGAAPARVFRRPAASRKAEERRVQHSSRVHR